MIGDNNVDLQQPHTYFNVELRDVDNFKLQVRADFDEHFQGIIFSIDQYAFTPNSIQQLRDLLNTLPLED